MWVPWCARAVEHNIALNGFTKSLGGRSIDDGIRAGTLTGEERQVINHHIVATIKMLEALPWPKHLKNVPEYAGGHHERMDGKGYPKGLKGDQIPVPARMMAILSASLRASS